VRAHRRLAAALAVLLGGCRTAAQAPAQPPSEARWRFTEVAAAAGLRFTHDAGAVRPRTLAETMGPGLAWLDFDGDDWPDLMVANGIPAKPAPGADRGLRLWRNKGDGTFVDVTERAGINRKQRYAMGFAVGDYDADGRQDIYVTCIGPNALFRNRGAGAFEEVSRVAGVEGPATLAGGPKWSTGAAFFDADGDNDLDLYVANFCAVRAGDRLLRSARGVLSTPSPTAYPAQGHLFFRNQGGGRFVETAVSLGLSVQEPQRGLTVLPFHADGDEHAEIFVGNARSRSFFFRRAPGGTFAEAGFEAGLAVSEVGADRTARAAAIGDVDGNGRTDLMVSHAEGESLACYLNQDGVRFLERGSLFGLPFLTRRTSGYGLSFLATQPGDGCELVKVNGRDGTLAAFATDAGGGQTAQLLTRSEDRFVDASLAAGAAFRSPLSGRSCAAADYDRDGDLDLAVSVNGGPLQLWRGEPTGVPPQWVSIRLGGRAPNTEAIGARVSLTRGAQRWEGQVASGGVYLGDGSRTLLFDLGSSPEAVTVEVRWPTGKRQTFRNVPAGSDVKIIEGVAVPRPASVARGS